MPFSPAMAKVGMRLTVSNFMERTELHWLPSFILVFFLLSNFYKAKDFYEHLDGCRDYYA